MRHVKRNVSRTRHAMRPLSSPVAPGALALVALVLGACATNRDATDGEAGAPVDQLGTVELPATCGEAVDEHLSRGLALLHHMTYEPAEEAFAAAITADSACALGYWGQAMTYVHPLWSDPPSADKFARGAELVERARGLPGLADVELSYVGAIGAYFDVGRQTAETPNLTAFAAAWDSVAARFPDDAEAAAFQALSMLGTVDPSDKTYEVQNRANEIGLSILVDHPRHPGAHHYLIHANDYPALAKRTLDIARAYGQIAPEVPHALHMPTHIFTRLGLWEESNEGNQKSAEIARRNPVNGMVSLHLMHALDYLAYADLQLAKWDEAQAVLDSLRALDGPFMVEIATPYTLAAVPARLALEREAWPTAAALPARTPAAFPWDDFPAIEAITHFARGIGAARSGDPAAARNSVRRLATLRDAAARTSAYWADQVEIQRLAVEGWAAHAAGDDAAGLTAMREAARREGATEKHPVTPGEILPARELLGEMLLDLGRYEEAETAFAATLERSPGRRRSLYGAGRAAELAGDTVAAAQWYREVPGFSAPPARARP